MHFTVTLTYLSEFYIYSKKMDYRVTLTAKCGFKSYTLKPGRILKVTPTNQGGF